MYVRDLEGNEYPLQATITYNYELNGNQSVSFRVLPSKVNELFIHTITEMWEVVTDTTYKVIYCKKRGSGDKLTVEIRAVPLFFDTFDTQRIYEEYNEHMTAQACFTTIFKDSGFSFILNGTFAAIQWEGFGAGDTRLTLFKNALNRYKAEFYISGKTIYLENLIGRDTSFMYRYKLNASNIVQENDASAYYTYAKGYGDFSIGEWQDAKLIREYTSPLSSFIGKREAPPIKNGLITTNTTMDEQLKELVDSSLKISVSADIHDLKAYPLAQPQVGDRAFLIDERIGLETEIRIQTLSITKEWKGKILNLQAQFGSPNIVKRHQSNLQTAISNINKLVEGSIKLPFSVLDNAVAEATKALKSAQTELQFTENGILAIDKIDPNFVVLVNSKGIGVSTDGGATFENAITGRGVNANTVIAGTMLADRILGGTLTLGGEVNGRMQVLNSDGEVIADLDADRGGFSDLNVGNLTVTQSIDAPGIVKELNDDITFYVSGTHGNDNNSGTSWANALYSANEALSRLPKFINSSVTIYFHNDYNISENITLRGFSGGGVITLDFRTYTTFKGRIKTISCGLRVFIINGNIRLNGDTNLIDNESSQYVEIINMKLSGNGQSHGIRTWRGGRTYIRDCEIYNVVDCISVSSTGHVYSTDNVGLGSRYGIYVATGGAIGYSRNYPMGQNADINITDAGISNGAGTPNSGAATPPAPPVTERTQSWSASDSASWTEAFGGVWDNTTGRDVLQGKWGTAGRYRGLWFFGSGPRNAANGHTIKRIRVRLHRSNNSGYSSSVSAVIRPHGYSSKPGGTQSWLGASHTVGFKWGESKWVTLPSSFHSYFENGSAYGIMIYTTSTANSNYMRFTGSATIEITWEE